MTKKPTRLNPFENQVYFHSGLWQLWQLVSFVLIPLRIRSISTMEPEPGMTAKTTRVS